MSSRLRVPGMGRLRRRADQTWIRLRSRLTRLKIKLQGRSDFVGDAENSCAPHGALFLNPYAADIMRDFRWRDYLRLNHDLAFDTAQQASEHFVFKGYNEQRLTDPERLHKLDPMFYRNRYPELALRSNWEAQVHYSYVGYYEKRVANSVDEWASNATLHIFQPGKVGSHAIAAAIEGKYPGGALHLHWPTDLPLYFPWCSLSYPSIVALPRPRRLRVISAGRDIVSQTLSGAFQYLSTTTAESGGRADLEQVRTYLHCAFESNCHILGQWFNHQFYCGMDIYAHAFDHKRGFVQLSNDTIELFLYRQENLSRLEAELGRFLEIKDFRLQRTNAAEAKAYHADYRELLDSYVIPSSLLEQLYSTPYMRHFFSDQEREERMEYWSRPRRGNSRP